MMKKFIAIGHWDDSNNMTSVASTANSIKNFREDCGGNGFIPYIIISEKKFAILKETLKVAYGSLEIFEEVKKLTTNYRKWNDITDYICDCFDIMEAKMDTAQ